MNCFRLLRISLLNEFKSRKTRNKTLLLNQVNYFFLYMSSDIKMELFIPLGLESQKNNEIALDDIVFNLMCKGESKIAKMFIRNYLKNFYKRGIE